jgi:hypothetical protein
MDTLRQQAKACAYWLVFLGASAYYFFRKSPKIEAIFSTTDSLGLSWTLIPLALLYLYEKKIWKWLNPRLDFDGYWDFEEAQYIVTPKGNTLDFAAAGHMRIVQDTRAISIVEGRTYRKITVPTELPRQVANWHSDACELNAAGTTITATLVHDASPDRPGGSLMYGVEVFTVADHGRRDWPIQMSSTVYHCIGSGQPRLVFVQYTRRARRHWWRFSSNPMLTKFPSSTAPRPPSEDQSRLPAAVHEQQP